MGSSALPIKFFFLAFQVSLPCLGLAPRAQVSIPPLPAAVARASATPVIKMYARACLPLRAARRRRRSVSSQAMAAAAMASMTCTSKSPSGSNVIISTHAPFVSGYRAFFSLVARAKAVSGLRCASGWYPCASWSLTDVEQPSRDKGSGPLHAQIQKCLLAFPLAQLVTTICSALVPHTRRLPVFADVHGGFCTWRYEARFWR